MSAPHESGPMDNLAFEYVTDLIADTGRPLTLSEITETLTQFPADALQRIVENAHYNGRLDLVDAGYTLPHGGLR